MAVAKRREIFKKVKKKVKEWLPEVFAPPSVAPGQMDYPAISKVLEAKKKRKKLLNEIGK